MTRNCRVAGTNRTIMPSAAPASDHPGRTARGQCRLGQGPPRQSQVRGVKVMIPEKTDQRANRENKGSSGGRPSRFLAVMVSAGDSAAKVILARTLSNTRTFSPAMTKPTEAERTCYVGVHPLTCATKSPRVSVSGIGTDPANVPSILTGGCPARVVPIRAHSFRRARCTQRTCSRMRGRCRSRPEYSKRILPLLLRAHGLGQRASCHSHRAVRGTVRERSRQFKRPALSGFLLTIAPRARSHGDSGRNTTHENHRTAR
jgi:hypothetical protein